MNRGWRMPNDHRNTGADEVPEPAILAELSRSIAPCDMTARIMGRLGFARISPRQAWWRRVRRLAVGTGTVTAMLIAAVVGVQLHRAVPHGRAPSGPTIPTAIQHDLQHHTRTIERAIRTIRNFPPQGSVQPPFAREQAEPTSGEPLDREADAMSGPGIGWV